MQEGTFNSSFLFKNEEETGNEGETVEIQGDFPDWVKGTVFAVGPGKFHFKDSGFTVNHVGDGYAVVFKLAISGNKITLWKKYAESDALKKANEAGKPVLAELFTPSSTDKSKSTLGRIMSFVPENTDNANHGIYYFGDRIHILNGLAYLREIHPKDLTSGIKFDTNKFGMLSLTPHPLIDHDGTMYNSGCSMTATGAKQKIFKIPAIQPGETFKDNVKKLKIIATVPSSRAAYSSLHHSFAMSENYIVLIDQPYLVNAKKMLAWMFTGGQACLQDFSEWHPEEINRFVIVEKSTGKVHKRKIVSAEPFFFLHVVNCYEENNQLVLDVMASPNNSNVTKLLLKSVINGTCCNSHPDGILKRFVLPLDENLEGRFGPEVCLESDGSLIVTGGCMSKKGLQHSVTINPNYRFRKYRYAYGNAGFYLQGPYASQITKFDLVEGVETSWEYGEDCIFGEIVFIPKPDAIDEDDGILLSGTASAFCSGGHRSVVFLCAKTMVEIGRAEFQSHLGLYMHHIFIPSLF